MGKRLLAVFLLSLGLPGYSAAQQPQAYSDFSGGLNTWRKSILLGDNESPSLQNVLLDDGPPPRGMPADQVPDGVHGPFRDGFRRGLPPRRMDVQRPVEVVDSDFLRHDHDAPPPRAPSFDELDPAEQSLALGQRINICLGP